MEDVDESSTMLLADTAATSVSEDVTSITVLVAIVIVSVNEAEDDSPTLSVATVVEASEDTDVVPTSVVVTDCDCDSLLEGLTSNTVSVKEVSTLECDVV